MSRATISAKARAWWADARSNVLFARALIGAGLVIVADQASKLAIVHLVKLPEQWRECAKAPGEMCRQIALTPIFDLTYVQNRGASFGMLAGGLGSRILLSAISIAIAVALTIWLGRIAKPLPAIAVALIIGGAVGNLYDRIAYGYVVDFLDFTGLAFPWVFNIADAAINVGVGLLLLDAFLEGRGAEKA